MDNNIPQNTDLNPSQNLPQTVPTKPDSSFKKILFIIGLIIFTLLVGSGSYLLGQNSVKPAIPIIPTITQIVQEVCTLEAKICPDGSSVGRTGPNCEFTPCPTAIPSIAIAEPSIDPKMRCTDFSVKSLNDAQAYIMQKEEYNKISDSETKFEGILIKNPPLPSNVSTTLMREPAYKLNGINISTHDDLSAYINKTVIITGKVNTFQLEGSNLTEIIPISISCK